MWSLSRQMKMIIRFIEDLKVGGKLFNLFIEDINLAF